MAVNAASSKSRSSSKSPRAFRTISEVSGELDVPQHVLRFWESKFTQISPTKRGGGRRYYRPEDINMLVQIRDLLYDDGYTIKGVQKLLDGDNRKRNKGSSSSNASRSPSSLRKGIATTEQIRSIHSELVDIRKLL